MHVLITICSKSPNPCVYECIYRLYKFQINTTPTSKACIVDRLHPSQITYKVCIVDSDSEDITNYTKIKSDFPDVDIHLVKNKNYEYGAWKFAYTHYPSHAVYMCIQDSVLLTRHISLDNITNTTAYTFYHDSGYNSDPAIKRQGINNLKQSSLDHTSILIDTNFRLAQHSCFIVTNEVIADIFRTLPVPPVDKVGSCFYERNFGLYFIFKNIRTINLYNFFVKYHGKRL